MREKASAHGVSILKNLLINLGEVGYKFYIIIKGEVGIWIKKTESDIAKDL